MDFSIEKAKDILDTGMSQAQDLVKDPSKVEELLQQLEEKLQGIPVAGTALAEIPTLILMVKGYITKEYTNVSLKVILTILGAFIYLVRKNDIIPDSVPVLGLADDIAVITLALKYVEPEVKAYKEWRVQ